MPILFEDPQYAENLSKNLTNQPISEIEAIAQQPKTTTIKMLFPKELEQNLMRDSGSITPPVRLIPMSQVYRILQAVRKVILSWSLKLEENGILGDEMTFSSEEVKLARQSEYNITNYFGDVYNSNNSGTVLTAQDDINVGGDVVGRDKEDTIS